MNTHRTTALAFGLLLSLPAFLWSQETTAPAAPTLPTPGSDEQPIVLSTFTVDVARDRGYVAVDSLAGGRTNTPIKLTPAAMSSLTRTFLDDLGIQDVREALKWSPNVLPEDPLAGHGFGGQAFHPWAFSFRGVGSGQQGGAGPTRNYFTFFENADAYNIERVEFARGPNGILFGLGTVGGTLSTYTKVPRLDQTFVSPAVTADNNGSLRFELDYNLAVTDKLALRVNALHDTIHGWRNGDDGTKRAIDLAALYKITDRTSLRLEVEGYRSKYSLISTTIGDKASGWDGQTVSETWNAPPTGGTARTVEMSVPGAWGTGLEAYPVFIPTLSGNQRLMLWAPWSRDPDAANPGQTIRTYRGGYATTSSLLDPGQALTWAPYAGWYPDQIKLPWETSFSSTANVPIRPGREWTYGSGRGTNDYENLSVFLDHSFNENVDLQVAFFTYDTETTSKDYEGTGGASVDINRQLPDGSPNPNFGKTFADFFLARQTQGRSVDEIRAQLNYKIDGDMFGSRFNQLFAASASQRNTKTAARQYLAQIVNGTWPTDEWADNMVWGRIYLDQPNTFTDIPDGVNGYTVAYAPAQGYWFDFDDEFELTSYALFSNTRLFDDALSIALGVRYDSYDEDLVSYRRGPNFTDQRVSESDEGTTYTAGAVYYFGWLGVFGNYSENILPPNAGSQPYLNGGRPGPEENEGYDYGLRISTADGKYYASFSRYESKSANRNVENPVGIRGVWQKYNLARGAPQDEGLGGVAYSDTTAMEASGYEFEVTANPLENLRIQASYALPETEIIDFYPMAREHVTENLATWNTQLAATTDPIKASDLRNEISRVQDTLAQSVAGVPQRKAVDYTASVFANYTFSNEALDGYSVGVGGNYTGKPYAGSYGGEEYFGSSLRSYSAVLAYETTFGRVKARFALNVDNIFDYDEPLVIDYHNDYADQSGRHIRNSYYYQTPRTYRLTARFTF